MIPDWLDDILADSSVTDLAVYGQTPGSTTRQDGTARDGDPSAGSDGGLIDMIQAQARSRRHR